MRLRGFGAAIAVFVAATMITSANGAIDRPARIDLSSRAAINAYLKSIGVNPAGVVVQRGQRNYAGPKCPGKGWTCTRSTRVVQIATAPARGLQGRSARAINAADCTPGTAADPPDCVLVQGGPVNSANVKQIGSVLKAAVTQTGTSNTATIIQQWSQRDTTPTSTGTATQNISLTQTAPDGGSNSASINQVLAQQANVRTAGNIVQTYQADQFIDINQSGSNGATNSVTTSQTTTQDIVGRTTGAGMTVTQSENASDLDGTTPRNISAKIDQDSDTGTNNATRRQKLTMNALATATNGNITQTQGSTDGGIDASSDDSIHQHSTGVSTSTNTLDEAIKTSASTTGTVSQTQHGPLNCCSGQESNPNNVFTVGETATLTASDPAATQTSLIQGDASSSGNTSLTQTQTIDGETQTQTCTSSSCDNTLTESSASGDVNFNNTDVAYFGFGGMRGNGTGSIAVTGVTGTVTMALLYWNGPTNSTDPTANASVTFNGTPVTGVNIGFSSDNCWGFANSQSYRADVTSLVSGDGTYSLANFIKPTAEVNGASLVVFYNDGNSANDRNVALFNGNDSNFASTFDAAGWDITIPGVNYPGGSASLDFIVSDGQTYPDDALILNGSTLAATGQIFDGDTVPAGPGGIGNGSLWDVKSFDITSFLSPGANTLHLTTGLGGDCLSAVVVGANVPSAAPIP